MKLDIVAGGVAEEQHRRDNGGCGDRYQQENGSAGACGPCGAARLRAMAKLDCRG